jgi:hypothetical protein
MYCGIAAPRSAAAFASPNSEADATETAAVKKTHAQNSFALIRFTPTVIRRCGRA